MDHYNKLTPAEAERLAMLSEEAGEIVQAVSKILRHGYANYHPDDPTTDNRDLLSAEITDMMAVLSIMENNNDLTTDFDLDFDDSNESIKKAIAKKMRYARHQNDETIKAGDAIEYK
ncbi:MazG nucleotide pyrophosphohydrolase domain-containing protein [Sulfitobacter sp. R18_1]|uniref:MazG nucleotide pyrophosphohydrolase domain-containing protein n=1 Tax=Sulfitobacter sp. R18_1 TaxID=2821104 RepID=UPI001ADA4AAD|nr:MazG nucleotide pyrophosphohydrolase domain-containing protein [Sulfitobacter sp. R18_1]MBO9427995.1 hypothetical protein [Sulfitobacter sp. R18_1]